MKVSLLLPVASAVLTAALLVIPDGQTTNQIILDGSHRQAPIASDDKAKPVDAEKPLVGDGDAGSQAPDPNQCRTGRAEHYDGLHPEYVLRWDLHQEDHFEDGQININTFEGFHPGAWHAQRYHRRLPPRYFHHKYHHPGGYQGYHESPPLPPVGHRDEVIWSVHRHPAGPGGDEGQEWPPEPPGDMLWPTSRPRMPTGRPTGVPPGVPTAVPPGVPTAVPPGVPTALPTGVPGDDPHWPPKPPSWPPKPPGDPGDRPHWPPKPPGHPGDPPPHHPPSPPHHPPPPPHHPPPHHGPPYHPPPHHFKPHRHNETIWQLISKANITSSFAKAVSHFDDLVAILNSTTANHTVFVPTNCAFERLKKFLGDKKIPREAKKKAITYHILNEPYPMFRLLFAHTAPSSLISDDLGGAQRLRFGLGHHGFAVNFYSHIRAANIFASNGIIHGVDSILIPPPSIPRILRLFPAQFSTWYLAVYLSNITHEVPLGHTGATLFAPPNSAWERLPPRVSSFLFSPWGRKYLKALVKYHIVLNETLYSDAYYHSTSSSGEEEAKTFPRRHFHVDLPTLLDGKHLGIDIGHLGPIINIVINGQSTVKVQDGLAKDGVIQVVSNLLIPPRKPPPGVDEAEHWDTSDMEIKAGLREMTLEEFKDRFEGLLEADDEEVDGQYKEEAGGNIISLWDY